MSFDTALRRCWDDISPQADTARYSHVPESITLTSGGTTTFSRQFGKPYVNYLVSLA